MGAQPSLGEGAPTGTDDAGADVAGAVGAARVVPPRALWTTADYPSGAHGQAEVELELMITADGAVRDLAVLRGEAPFRARAEEAARAFRFAPARRGGEAVEARIRFLVTFVEPAAPAPAAGSTTPPEPPSQQPPEPPAPAGTTAASPTEPELVVQGERPGLHATLHQEDFRQLPGAFGDPFRAIEVLPGVTPIVSGLPYFYVRGAPPGNVGYLFDGIPIPILFHFAAGPGVLHPALIDQVNLYAGAYPARYGRYAGGIVEGTIRPAGTTLTAEASVRLLDTGLMARAPLPGGKGSVMVAGRYSYTALALSLLTPNVSVNYWDYQVRANYDLTPKDSVEVLWFGSNDYVTQERPPNTSLNSTSEPLTETLVDLTFHRADLRWQRRLPRGQVRQAVTLGLDQTGLADGQADVGNLLVGTRTDFATRLSERATLRGGGNALYERLSQRLQLDTLPSPPNTGLDSGLSFDVYRPDVTTGVYAEVVFDVTPALELIPGLRADLFASGSDYILGVDPRVTARFKLRPDLTVIHGFGLAHQAPSFIVPIPGFKPSLAGGLQTAAQHTAGVEWELPRGFSSSVIGFHNLFFDMTDFFGTVRLSGAQVGDSGLSDFRADGRAYGVEVSLKRSLSHRLGGFLSYTLGRSERFAGRASGPSSADRTHVLNLAASYEMGKNWRLGSRLIVYSGVPATMDTLAGSAHPARTSPFWRVDWRLQKRWMNADGKRYWGLIIEVLNTTLNKEAVSASCTGATCNETPIGPITIPNIGVEATY